MECTSLFCNVSFGEVVDSISKKKFTIRPRTRIIMSSMCYNNGPPLLGLLKWPK